MQSIQITCKLTALEDFHIGTGIGNIGLYDDGQLKDKDGISLINASSFKGLLRDSCEQLGRITKLLGKEDGSIYFTQLFEHFDNLSSLDIQIEPLHNITNPTVIHYFTAVRHDLRRAKTNTLRSVEFGSKNQEFTLTIRYLCRNDNASELTDYLLMGLKNIKAIGGHRRRGFGAIAITDVETDICSITAGNPVIAGTMELDLILELAEDTILGSRAQSGNLLSSNDYIPGTTILGMFRAALLAQKSRMEYLDEDRVAASFFYPLPADDPLDFQTKLCPVFFSFRKKKQYQIPLQKDVTIPPWALQSANSNKFIDILSQNPLHKSEEHSDPGKGMYDGYIATAKSDINWDNSFYYQVPKRSHQRNHIDRAKQSTQEGGVFIEERIPKATRFIGRIGFTSEADCAAFISDFDAWFSIRHALHIGRGGKPIFINKWQFCHGIESSAVTPSSEEFTISLLSDTILYDSFLLPLSTIDAVCMKELLGEPWLKSDIQLASAISRSGIISSFSGTSGLRKFRDLVIRKGSCFRFTARGCDMEALLKRLSELESQGIGFRKNEGFGEIAINHPLHLISPGKAEEVTIGSKICRAIISDDEHARLAAKATHYRKASELAKKLIKHTKDKWRSVVADLIVKMEAGMDYDVIRQSLKDKMQPESSSEGNHAYINSNAIPRSFWGNTDSRHIIAGILIAAMDADESPEVIATALKLTLNSKGGTNE